MGMFSELKIKVANKKDVPPEANDLEVAEIFERRKQCRNLTSEITWHKIRSNASILIYPLCWIKSREKIQENGVYHDSLLKPIVWWITTLLLPKFSNFIWADLNWETSLQSNSNVVIADNRDTVGRTSGAIQLISSKSRTLALSLTNVFDSVLHL